MTKFVTRLKSETCDTIAPDGSEVRFLASTGRGSMAHFSLPPGQVSVAVAHRTVEEIWYIIAGTGRIWRKSGEDQEITDFQSGVSISIPIGTHFQFRNDGQAPLEAVGVTMPPWPGKEEAFAVEGVW